MSGHIFHPLANFIRERKSRKYESNGYLQKAYQLDKSYQLQAPCFLQEKSKCKVCKGVGSTVDSVVTVENTTNP